MKALLVNFGFSTRVVVPEDSTDEHVVQAAIENMHRRLNGDFSSFDGEFTENVRDIALDTEMPYNVEKDKPGEFGVYKKLNEDGRPVFYQPILTDEEWAKVDLLSFGVYLVRANCERDFPGKEIGEYTSEDIEAPTFIDAL